LRSLSRIFLNPGNMPCGGVAACTAASKLVKIKFNRSIKFNLSKIKKGELYFQSGKEINSI